MTGFLEGGSVYPDIVVLSTQIEYGEVNSERTPRIILTNANVELRGKQEKFDYMDILDALKKGAYPHLILSVNLFIEERACRGDPGVISTRA